MARNRSNLPRVVTTTAKDGTIKRYFYDRETGRKLTEEQYLAIVAELAADSAPDSAPHAAGQARVLPSSAPAITLGDNMKLGTLLDEWMQSTAWRKNKPRTSHKREAAFSRPSIVALRGIRVRDITQRDLEKLHEAIAHGGLARHGRRVEGMADYVIDTLKAAFSWGRKKCGMTVNPFEGLERFGIQEGHRVWSDAELVAMSAAMHPGMARAIKLCLRTSLRIGDLLDLTWGQWNSETRELELKPEKTERTSKVVQNYTFDDAFCAELEAWRAQDEAELGRFTGPCGGAAAVQSIEAAPIVRRFAGRPVSYKRWAEEIARCRRVCGIRGKLSMHGVRATVVVRGAHAGLTDAELRALTGHTTAAALKPYLRHAEQKRIAAGTVHKVAAFVPEGV
jgi:integrase